MPPWLVKIPHLIRQYGPIVMQGYVALRELVGAWRDRRRTASASKKEARAKKKASEALTGSDKAQ